MAILGFNRRLAALSAAAFVYACMALLISLGPPDGGPGGARLALIPPEGALAIEARLRAVSDLGGLITLSIETAGGQPPPLRLLRHPKADSEAGEPAPASLPEDIELRILPAGPGAAAEPGIKVSGKAHLIKMPGPGSKVMTRRYLLIATEHEIRLIPRKFVEDQRKKLERRKGRMPPPGGQAPLDPSHGPGPDPR